MFAFELPWRTFVLLLCIAPVVLGSGRKFFDLPPQPPAHEYGDVLIDEASRDSEQKPVVFSHWSHRSRYACRVCHFELPFELRANASGITEEANQAGEFCGACHDGETAFGHAEGNCSKCHSGASVDKRSAFKRFRKSLDLPKSLYGNGIDWVEAEVRGLIEPKLSIFEPDFEPLSYDEEFEVPAAWALIPPADFSHAVHLRWLECSSCHPDIFKLEREGTEHFLMENILDGRFCGACHMTVAFPIDDCKGCHPKMKY